MFSYSASSVSKILRYCLENLEQKSDPNDLASLELKRTLLRRIREAEAHMPRMGASAIGFNAED